jgi:hypothetical protein
MTRPEWDIRGTQINAPKLSLGPDHRQIFINTPQSLFERQAQKAAMAARCAA